MADSSGGDTPVAIIGCRCGARLKQRSPSSLYRNVIAVLALLLLPAPAGLLGQLPDNLLGRLGVQLLDDRLDAPDGIDEFPCNKL